MKQNQTKPQNEMLDVKNNQESQENQETFYFYSASLGRRVLSYLADIFISFILCVFVFEIIYWPITKPCISYEEKVKEITVLADARIQLMYDEEFLFYENDETKYSAEPNIDYTGKLFTEFYVFKDQNDKTTTLNFDPIIHYYEDVCTTKNYDRDMVISFYFNSEGESEYFEKYSGSAANLPTLKQKYIERWAPFFDENDEVSEDVKTEINTFILTTFRVNYLPIIEDFAKNNIEYVSYTNLISSIYDEFDFYYQLVTFGAFLTVFIALFVVVPLTNKRGQTIGKMVCKLNVVNRKNFQFLSKKARTARILLNLLEQIPVVLFIPFISVGFNNLFNLPVLLIFTIVGAIYCIVSMVITLINSYRLSIKELLTNTVICDRDLIDKYFREVVYAEKATRIE